MSITAWVIVTATNTPRLGIDNRTLYLNVGLLENPSNMNNNGSNGGNERINPKSENSPLGINTLKLTAKSHVSDIVTGS